MEFQTRDIEPVLCWHPVTVMTFTRFRQVLVILVQFMTFISTDIEIWTWQPCLHLTWSFSLSVPISKILSTFYSRPSKPAPHWSKQGMKNTKIPGDHSATPLSLTWHEGSSLFLMVLLIQEVNPAWISLQCKTLPMSSLSEVQLRLRTKSVNCPQNIIQTWTLTTIGN